MKKSKITRRKFVGLSGLALASIALVKRFGWLQPKAKVGLYPRPPGLRSNVTMWRPVKLARCHF